MKLVFNLVVLGALAVGPLVVSAVEDPAVCCTDFTSECYTTESSKNYFHSCSKDSPVQGEQVCEQYCGQGQTDSLKCKSCCTHYTDRLASANWSCPKASKIHCRTEDPAYGLGIYTNERDENQNYCLIYKNNDASFYVPFAVSSQEDCISKCESIGVPGCCQFKETVTETGNLVSNCKFMTVKADTIAGLSGSINGTEPYIASEPSTEPDVYRRAVRCDMTESVVGPIGEETNPPKTQEPDSAASQIELSVFAALSFVATGVAIQ